MSWIDDINGWGANLNNSIRDGIGQTPTQYPKTGSNLGNSFGTSTSTSPKTTTSTTTKTTTTMAGGAIKTADGTVFNTVAEKYPYRVTTPYMSGDGIKKMQAALNAKAGAGLEVHGIFGNAAKTALANFQKSKGLTADGIYGDCSRFHLEGIGSCSSGGSSGGGGVQASASAGSTQQASVDTSALDNLGGSGSGSGGGSEPRPTIFGLPQELFWGLGLGIFLVVGGLMATKYRVFEANKIVL